MRNPIERTRLTLVVGDARFALKDGESYRIGRGDDCELRINHASVGDHHARISCHDGVAEVEDLGSPGGTWLNGARVESASIEPGQEIQFGAIFARLADPLAEPLPAQLPTLDASFRFREPAFSELMADELRKVPWFTLSAVIHLAVFLILYLVFQEPIPGPTQQRRVSLHEDQTQALEEAEELSGEDRPEIEEELEVVRELARDPLADDSQADEGADSRYEEILDFDPRDTAPVFSGGELWLRNVKSSASDILASEGVRSQGFKKTVSRMRRSGLEIAFVFDSTGSMASILNGTKERIAHMAEMLHALVPDARIGVVTYRDRDPEEEYLTRQVPLSGDFYRSINFMKVVAADGGGSRPEAILDGLNEAFGLAWNPRSRRVVVLIGDAPSHERDEKRLEGAIRGFAANGKSFVHAIVTSPFGVDNLGKDTTRSFRQIADAGKGECIAFEDESLVLQQVLSLAFGRQYRKNLDEVSRIVTARRDRVETFALDMVRREDFSQIDEWLRKEPVSDEVVKALCRSQSRGVARHLAVVLTRRDMPQSSRQAAAHAMTQILNGRVERTMTRILNASIERGRSARKPPWELRVLSADEADMLRRAIEEE